MVRIRDDEFCSVLLVTEIPRLTTPVDANAATSDAWTTATGSDELSDDRDIFGGMSAKKESNFTLVLLRL